MSDMPTRSQEEGLEHQSERRAYWRDRAEAAEAENAKLREALEWVDEMTRGRSGVSGISDYVRAALADPVEWPDGDEVGHETC